jgi:hypothetical protein
MTGNLDDDTLERFAIAVQDLPPKDADFEYSRLIAKEKSRRKYAGILQTTIDKGDLGTEARRPER